MFSNTIKQLWLEGNNLSSQCITTIADALKKCTNISILSLRDNNISEEVADVLSEALSNKCVVTNYCSLNQVLLM